MTGGDEAPLGDGEGHVIAVIVRVGLVEADLVKGRVGWHGVALVASGAEHQVGGAMVRRRFVVDVAAVAVRVHVACEHEVDAERIERFHEVVADVADAACVARARLVLVVGDDVLVH